MKVWATVDAAFLHPSSFILLITEGTMSRQITRRGFVKASAGSAILGAAGLSSVAADALPDLVACQGPDAEQNARAVVEALGGMGRFVKRGQIVALLPNIQGPRPGASVDVGIIKAVASMCREAGAREIRCLTWLPQSLWERPDVKNVRQALDEAQVKLVVAPLPPPPAKPGDPPPPETPEVAAAWRTLEVPKGIKLKQVRVSTPCGKLMSLSACPSSKTTSAAGLPGY